MPETKPLTDEFFAGNFNTALTPENERRFAAWATGQSLRRGRDVLADSRNYDIRGYWLNGGWNDSGTGHMPDTYKKPNHPTFSNESIYHGTPSPYGTPWEGGSWGEGTFTPSLHMLARTHNWDDLAAYMKLVEPGVVLVPPLKRSR